MPAGTELRSVRSALINELQSGSCGAIIRALRRYRPHGQAQRLHAAAEDWRLDNQRDASFRRSDGAGGQDVKRCFAADTFIGDSGNRLLRQFHQRGAPKYET